MRITTGLRVGAAAVGALSALAILPGGASAAFDGAHASQCASPASIAGRGASFQRQAQLAWGAQLLAPDPGAAEANGFGYATTPQGGCSAFALGGSFKVTYEPMGSGDGRKAFGASTVNANPGATPPVAQEAGIRDTRIQFGGADEPPTAAQLTQANIGPDHAAGTADDAVLHTIPVAQSSVAVVVKLPAGCTVPAASRKISRVALDGAFGASVAYRTWGAILPAISGAGCSDKPLTRVVRFDSSGTTFAFKNYLRAITLATWPTSLGNTAWPNDSGATATVRPAANGAGALLDTLSAQTTNGGIGYADLASARARGYDSATVSVGGSPQADDADSTLWLSVERKDGAYQSPALNDLKGTATPGSNCRNVSYSDPATGKLPSTTESWATVDGTATVTDYPLCALTYALAWEDMAKASIGHAAGRPDYTQDQARAVRDYLGYALNVNGGQAALAPNGYQALPSVNSGSGAPVDGSVLAIAQAGQAKLTWNKQTVVDPGPGDGGGDPDPGNGGNGGNTNPPVVTPPGVTPPIVTPPVVKPPVVAPPTVRANVKLGKASAGKGRVLALTVTPSGAGKLSVSATSGSGKKRIVVGSGSATAKAAGALKLTIKPTAKGRKALKAGRTVKLAVKVTFVAADGTRTTSSSTLKLKIKA